MKKTDSRKSNSNKLTENNNDTYTVLFTLFSEIGIINQLITTRLERDLPDNMKLAQFNVLNHFVRLNIEQTPIELASAFQVTKGAITNILKKLENKDMIKLRVHPEDRRSKLVSINAKGRKARDRALTLLAPTFSELASELPIKAIANFLPALGDIRNTLDAAR